MRIGHVLVAMLAGFALALPANAQGQRQRVQSPCERAKDSDNCKVQRDIEKGGTVRSDQLHLHCIARANCRHDRCVADCFGGPGSGKQNCLVSNNPPTERNCCDVILESMIASCERLREALQHGEAKAQIAVNITLTDATEPKPEHGQVIFLANAPSSDRVTAGIVYSLNGRYETMDVDAAMLSNDPEGETVVLLNPAKLPDGAIAQPLLVVEFWVGDGLAGAATLELATSAPPNAQPVGGSVP